MLRSRGLRQGLELGNRMVDHCFVACICSFGCVLGFCRGCGSFLNCTFQSLSFLMVLPDMKVLRDVLGGSRCMVHAFSVVWWFGVAVHLAVPNLTLRILRFLP